ncbi:MULTISPECIES: HlyD family secretion protein [unclassified Marichromatium]|uniref:HlyD family secretion protein n=1 Tax=unclassified Marichromatium TaxID=2618417 RepID=UPI000F3E0BC3|nr:MULTISPECIES: biotin/lipoyl-binding protein [unclassified Marichromatium]MBO8084822.1 biotin/lipoyl-binding protein [Marichromatium sp.]RNE90225.1 biotin/lipoyl-binding protein [Marichromatium sp. AB31]RNE93297.1 biotin/lipoyl-binding protein [Marichromatium sp. AB32]
MNRLLKLLLPVLILAVGFGVFQYLKQTRPDRPVTETRERVWRVALEPLEPRALAPMLELYGQVENPDLLRAAASASARVARVLVREGERVVPGQLLLELDPRDLVPALARTGAQVAELEAQLESERNGQESDQAALEQERRLLELSEDAVARAKSLTRRQVGSQNDLDIAEQDLARQRLAVSERSMRIADYPARRRALEARLQQARAEYEEARLAFARSRVVAPYAGVVSAVEVAVGDQVKTDEVLLSLYPLAGLEVRARIPAPYQAELAAALRNAGSLPASALVDGGRVGLVLERLAGEADPSGIDGLFTLTEGAEWLRIGQMLTLRLERPLRESVVAVPFAAVYGGNRVYTFVDGRMRAVAVRTLGSWFAPDGEERLLVAAPELVSGDQLVVTHMPNAVDGLRVEAHQ